MEDDVLSLNHELEHEARHLTLLGIGGGIVVDESHVVGTLQQAVEVMLVDGHLVVDGGQPVCLADGIGDERCVVDAARHEAFVAGEQ